MKRSAFKIGAFFAITFSVPSLAESAPETQQGSIPIGSWTSPCLAFGQQALCHSRWSRGLDGETTTIQDYRISSPDGAAVLFEGRGLYSAKGTNITGYWEDSTGGLYKVAGSWDGSVLDVFWGELGSGGRSVYEFSLGHLKVTDWALRETGWSQFMKVDYGDPNVGQAN